MHLPTELKKIDEAFDKRFVVHCSDGDILGKDAFNEVQKAKSFIHTVLLTLVMRVAQEVIEKELQNEIDYIEKYHIGSDYTTGFKGFENGPCCSKCKIDGRRKMGNMIRLALCADPYQVKCKCHIPYRQVAIASELHLLQKKVQQLRSHLDEILQAEKQK